MKINELYVTMVHICLGIFVVMVNIGTRIAVKLFYKYVGQDDYGNKYYQDRRVDQDGKYRRLVVYNGMVEATKIPPMWHAWMHYMSDDFPMQYKDYIWQEECIPNLTGTKGAYSPGCPYVNEMQSIHFSYWKPLDK